MAPPALRSLTRRAKSDGLNGCGLARVLAPHLDNLGSAERAAVLQSWAQGAASRELRSFAEPADTGVKTYFVCVTPSGQWPAEPPAPGAACFSGAHPQPWVTVQAGTDALIWLDDFVAAHELEIPEQIHIVTPLSRAPNLGSVRVRAAAADLRIGVFSAGAERQPVGPTFQTGPLMEAPYDQLVFPPPLNEGQPERASWLYAIITPSRAGSTRFGARLAGPHGERLVAEPSSAMFDAHTSSALRDVMDESRASPPPPHPCLPSRNSLLEASFERTLGLVQSGTPLETMAETIASTSPGAELALAILPAMHPESARHALLTRLRVDAPSAARPALDRALSAVALDRGQPARASLYAHAAGPAPRGVVDGLRARIALANGRSGEAADILSGCAADRDCPRPLVETLVQALLDIGLIADARAAIALHSDALPWRNPSSLWLRAHVGPKDAGYVKAHLRQQSDDAPTRALLRIASARGHLRAGDREGAEAELAKLRTPDSPTGWITPAGTRVQLAELYIELGLLDEARAIVTWTLAQSPADPWARALGDQLRARGGEAGDTPRAMQEVLALIPDDMSALFATPPIDLQALVTTPSLAPPDGWEIVSEQLMVSVAADGSATRLGRQIVRRGQGGTGAAPLAPLRWPWDPSRVSLELVRAMIHQPQTDKPDTPPKTFISRPLRGVTVESPDKAQIGLYYDELALVIPWTGVPEDALVELVWLATPVGHPFPGYFELNEYLSSRVPRRALDLIISAPSDLPITHRVIRSRPSSLDITETRTTSDDRTLLTLSVRDDRGLPNEPFAPPHAEIGALILATTARSWPELGAYYAGLMRGQARLTPEMRDAVAKIIAAHRGRSGEPNEALVTRDLTALVARRIRYVAMEFGVHSYKPYRTEDVWARRFGDCKDQALLLVTLLNAAGIAAEPVLVRTRRLGHIGTSEIPPPPMLALFDHAIVHLKARDQYVDPTTIHHGFDGLAPDNLGADVFILPWDPESAARLTRIPVGAATRNRVDGNFSVILDADGSAIIQGRVAYSGTQAGAWRSRLANEATRDQLVQTMIASTFRGFELSRFTVSGLDEEASQMRIVFEGEVRQLAQREARGLRISPPLPLGGQRTRVGEVRDRTLPFLLGTPGIGTFEVAWTLPQNHKLAEVPDGLLLESPKIRAAVEWRAPTDATKGPVTVTGRVELAFLAEEVPAAGLPALARILEALDKAIAVPLVLIDETAGPPGDE